MVCVFVVGNNNIFVNLTRGIDIVYQPVKNCFIAYFKKRFGKIFGKRVKAGCIACRKNKTFHKSTSKNQELTPFALLQMCTENLSLRWGNALRYSRVTFSVIDSSNSGFIRAIQQPLKPAPEKRPP